MYGGVVQRSKEQEEILREQCDVLKKDEAELHATMLLLEQDNQTLREQLETYTGTFHSYISTMRV